MHVPQILLHGTYHPQPRCIWFLFDHQGVPLAVESIEMKHFVMEWLEISSLHQLIAEKGWIILHWAFEH